MGFACEYQGCPVAACCTFSTNSSASGPLIAATVICHIQCCSFTLHCVSKICTPTAGQHKFIKISSPIMIFHTRHRHSVADRLSSKSLVRVEYQLQGFHENQAPNNRMQFITERIRRRRRLIYCL